MKFQAISVLATSALLFGCGGGSGKGPDLNFQDVTYGQSISGQFIDAPVKGLNYYVNGDDSKISQTGNNGSFECNEGDYITFRLGNNFVLGNAACGAIVAPTNFGASSSKIAAILQNIGGGTSAAILNVSGTVSKTFPYTSVSSVTDLSTLNAVLNAAGASSVSNYATALSDAEAAMNEYLASVIKIPKDYLDKTFTFDVTANLVRGDRKLCDTTSTFKAVATTRSSNEAGNVEASVTFYGEDDELIGTAPLYSTTFHVGFQIEDEDETYFLIGSGKFSHKGFSGSFVETTIEAEEAEYVGVSCAYSFANVAPTSVVDSEPEESFAE